MPYKKMYIKKKNSTDRVQNKRIKKLEKQVRTLNVTNENKVKDFNTGSVPLPVSTTPYRQLAFARDLATGPDGDNRIGNKVTLMSQTIRGILRAPASALTTEQQNQIRVIVVENIGYTGVTDLDLADVLQYGSFGSYGEQVFNSPYKTNAADSTKRYKVHFDRVFTVNQTEKGYVHFSKRISYGNKRMKGKVLTFNSPLDPYPNNHRLVLFAISDSSVANHPDISFNVRTIYKDA